MACVNVHEFKENIVGGEACVQGLVRQRTL